jgi:hypothetical protein
MSALIPLIVQAMPVSQDEHGNICLNDLWCLADKPQNNRPTDWRRSARALALEAALNERMVGNLHHSEQTPAIPTLYVQGQGRASRTFAHPVLALDYAEYLNPALGVEIRDVFIRYRAADISIANDILERIAEQVKEDELRLLNRGEMTTRAKDIGELGQRAGCAGWQYAELHNARYRGLYNGLDENGIHSLKQLKPSQKILDYMGAAEGAANVFAATQAALRMQRLNPKTPVEAFQIAEDAGVRTRQAMEEIGGVMPEKMPIPDSIGSAKKRLERNRALLNGKKPAAKKLPKKAPAR